MNIKEHLEAGHYRKLGEHNAEIVPVSDKRNVTICDVNSDGRISGWLENWDYACTWDADGKIIANGINVRETGLSGPNLLPPPPRKVKVTGWALVRDGSVVDITSRERLSACWRESPNGDETCVELTGEYEMPWDTKAQSSHPDTK